MKCDIEVFFRHTQGEAQERPDSGWGCIMGTVKWGWGWGEMPHPSPGHRHPWPCLCDATISFDGSCWPKHLLARTLLWELLSDHCHQQAEGGGKNNPCLESCDVLTSCWEGGWAWCAVPLERDTAKWKKWICCGTETSSLWAVNQSWEHREDRGEAGRQCKH